MSGDKVSIINSTYERSLPFTVRLPRYLSERFPLHQHGVLIAVFTFSAASYSRICREAAGFIPLGRFIAGAITAILFFLLLRIADEFKDFADDNRYRPYRAVPRGLVSLRELGLLAGGIIFFQVLVNALVMPRMLLPFMLALGYLALMTREFFVPAWLKRHPMLYMLSHMFIMPMVDLYTTGLDWVNEHITPSPGLMPFLVVSFSNGIVIEMGRKIRAPQAEEPGVETYSALLGVARATGIWLAVVAGTYAIAIAASIGSGFGMPGVPLLSCCLMVTAYPAVRFMRRRIPSDAKRLETAAGIWTLGMYLILGATPATVSFVTKALQP